MRRAGGAGLTPEQKRAADAGAKAMMPVGRPFLDYVLSALADAGITDVCVVVPADDKAIRERYTRDLEPHRLHIEFAGQTRPLGTADALRAARDFVGEDLFLALNADNYYSAASIRALIDLGAPGVAAYRAENLVVLGNIPIERVRAYAFLRADSDGMLSEIVEKPDAVTAAAFGPFVPISMNLWSFPPDVFDACDRVTPSPRGELELADAVRIAIEDFGVQFALVPVHDGVLDLSRREDVAAVTDRLRHVTVRL
jgi:glucose-1-phosphate thymidylyltransferase